MKLIRYILGALLVLTGGVWFLQGVDILPGSFMTGQAEWAVYGIITLAIGIVLLVLTNRSKSRLG